MAISRADDVDGKHESALEVFGAKDFEGSGGKFLRLSGVDGKKGTAGVKFVYAGNEKLRASWKKAINDAIRELQKATKQLAVKTDECL